MAAAQGQTIFAASGDSGSDSGSQDCNFEGQTGLDVDDPASQPTVTGVGGTSLSLLGSGSTETVWNDRYGSGGGGVSSNFTQPSCQTGPGTMTTPALCPLSSGIFTFGGAVFEGSTGGLNKPIVGIGQLTLHRPSSPGSAPLIRPHPPSAPLLHLVAVHCS